MNRYSVTVIGIPTPFEVYATNQGEALNKVLTENNLVNVEGDISLIEGTEPA